MRSSLVPRRRPIPRVVEGDRRCQPDDRSERPRQTQPHCRGRGLPQARTPTPRTCQTSPQGSCEWPPAPRSGPPTPSRRRSHLRRSCWPPRRDHDDSQPQTPCRTSSTRSGVVDSSDIKQRSITQPCGYRLCEAERASTLDPSRRPSWTSKMRPSRRSAYVCVSWRMRACGLGHVRCADIVQLGRLVGYAGRASFPRKGRSPSPLRRCSR